MLLVNKVAWATASLTTYIVSRKGLFTSDYFNVTNHLQNNIQLIVQAINAYVKHCTFVFMTFIIIEICCVNPVIRYSFKFFKFNLVHYQGSSIYWPNQESYNEQRKRTIRQTVYYSSRFMSHT